MRRIPNKTFYVDGSMNVAGERIDYGYLIEAHTSGDIYVFFRESNVLAVGDVASPSRDPELDYFTGAWLGGRVDAMDRLLALSDGDTRIVPGYGPVMSRADLQAERDMMKTIYDRAVDRVRQGDDADDMIKAGVLNGLARTWKDPQQVPLRRSERVVGAPQQVGAKCGLKSSNWPELPCSVPRRGLVASIFAMAFAMPPPRMPSLTSEPGAAVRARGSDSVRRSPRRAGDDRRKAPT